MGALIEGKVAQILSDRHVIVNIGASAGVQLGMTLVVLAVGEAVKDPATGEALGRWEMPKGFLRVTHVQERMSTCEGCALPGALAEEDASRVLSAAMIDASMRADGGGGTRLDVNRAQMTGMPRIGPISVGDPVREVPRAGNSTH